MEEDAEEVEEDDAEKDADEVCGGGLRVSEELCYFGRKIADLKF